MTRFDGVTFSVLVLELTLYKNLGPLYGYAVKTDALKYYELTKTVARLLGSTGVVTLKIFNKTFWIRLTEDTSILSNAKIILSNNKPISLVQTIPTFYTGEVFENAIQLRGRVSGTVDDETKQFEGLIKLEGVVYHIEDATDHGFSGGLKIVYRNIDILFANKTLYTDIIPKDYLKTITKRYKRTISTSYWAGTDPKLGLSCGIKYYVDHRFYKYYGKSTISKTLIIITTLHKFADDIFRSTDFNFDEAGDNIGLSINEIQIVTDENEIGYPFKENLETPHKYLNTFVNEISSSGFCLAVAMSTQHFRSENAVGLAYMGSSMSFSGGICSSGNALLICPGYHNTYHMSTLGRILTHELGHSFGSGHDDMNPSSSECRGNGTGGNFIMAANLSPSIGVNALKFSKCSREQILPVLVRYVGVPGCFEYTSRQQICGNTITEKNELCDCGGTKHCDVVDNCCTPSDISNKSSDKPCDYRKSLGRICSPRTSVCCENECKISRRGKVCEAEQDCTYESRCSGFSEVCSRSRYKPDGTPCSSGMYCFEGKCQRSVCVHYSMKDCACRSALGGYCRRCCEYNGRCVFVEELNLSIVRELSKFLPSGEACVGSNGICDINHVCRYRMMYLGENPFVVIFGRSSMSNTEKWFSKNLYYCILAVLVTAFSVYSISSFYLMGYFDSTTHAKRIARLHEILIPIDNHLDSIKRQMLLLRDGRNKVIGPPYELKPTDSAIYRLLIQFPDTKHREILRGLSMYTSEDLAVRHLIIKGCAFRKLFNADKPDRKKTNSELKRFSSSCSSKVLI